MENQTNISNKGFSRGLWPGGQKPTKLGEYMYHIFLFYWNSTWDLFIQKLQQWSFQKMLGTQIIQIMHFSIESHGDLGITNFKKPPTCGFNL